MEYVPVFGFFYSVARVIWAQRQLQAHLMTMEQEWTYLDAFSRSLVVTVVFLLLVSFVCQALQLQAGKS